MKNKIIIAAVALLLLPGVFPPAWGQQTQPGAKSTHRVDAAIYFRIGESRIDPEFEGNKFRLSVFTSALERVLADSNYVVSRMVVVGTASPDGRESVNNRLAGRRAQALADYLAAHTSLPADKIEVSNGGENWTGLRLMMESADKMPCRDAMLALMEIENLPLRKRKMMYYADSKPWLWMYEHLFPDLRKGAGGTQGRASLNKLSRNNWNTLRALIRDSDLDGETRHTLLEAVTREPDAARRLQLLRELSPDTTAYAALQDKLVTGLLGEGNALNEDNWTLLREKVAASDMPSRADVLRIIDSIPAVRGRRKALQTLDGGIPYRFISDRFLPELLVDRREVHTGQAQPHAAADSLTTLSAENWRRLRGLIAASEMPGRERVLDLIDNEPDDAVRSRKLRALNDGDTYGYINEVFFSELLYGLSPAARENWEQVSHAVGRSDLPRKEQILEIVRTTPPGIEREEAIRALDDSQSWRQMGELLLPELLQGTENIPLTGSGMSFSYEISPAAKARAALIEQRLAAAGQKPSETGQVPEAGQAPAEAGRRTGESPSALTHKPSGPRLALKTDLMLWGGIVPGFETGTWMPNLTAEICFARRWSVQAGWAYSNWDAFGGGLYAVSAADLEVRYWFGRASAFDGFFIGAYALAGQYDRKEAAQGQTGSFFGGGLGAGYLLPLSRRWGVEAEVRVGGRSAENDRYAVYWGHTYLDSSKTEGKFTPQVRLQIVYRIGKTGK